VRDVKEKHASSTPQQKREQAHNLIKGNTILGRHDGGGGVEVGGGGDLCFAFALVTEKCLYCGLQDIQLHFSELVIRLHDY
jgi:hypothetical protein